MAISANIQEPAKANSKNDDNFLPMYRRKIMEVT